MQSDGIEEAKRLLANYSEKRGPFTAERREAALKLLRQLESLAGYGWNINVDESALAATLRCEHVASKLAFITYDIHSNPPRWRYVVREQAVALPLSVLSLEFNLAEHRFEATGGQQSRRPAVLAVIEQILDNMSS